MTRGVAPSDHKVASYAHIAKLFLDGTPYGDLTRDDIFDNVTLFRLTNTGVSGRVVC